MTFLFAHHLEPEHVLIALTLFVAGAGIGWGMTSLLNRKNDGKVRPSA
jgi:hypothetical protein